MPVPEELRKFFPWSDDETYPQLDHQPHTSFSEEEVKEAYFSRKGATGVGNEYANFYVDNKDTRMDSRRADSHIQRWGFPVTYMSKEFSGNVNWVFGEDTKASFNENRTFRLRLTTKEQMSYDGDGDVYTPSGMFFDDKMILYCTKDRFAKETRETTGESYIPKEGDWIRMDINEDVFSVKFVNYDAVWWLNGGSYLWESHCVKLSYAGETVNTKVQSVDDLANDHSMERVDSNRDVQQLAAGIDGGFYAPEKLVLDKKNDESAFWHSILGSPRNPTAPTQEQLENSEPYPLDNVLFPHRSVGRMSYDGNTITSTAAGNSQSRLPCKEGWTYIEFQLASGSTGDIGVGVGPSGLTSLGSDTESLGVNSISTEVTWGGDNYSTPLVPLVRVGILINRTPSTTEVQIIGTNSSVARLNIDPGDLYLWVFSDTASNIDFFRERNSWIVAPMFDSEPQLWPI